MQLIKHDCKDSLYAPARPCVCTLWFRVNVLNLENGDCFSVTDKIKGIYLISDGFEKWTFKMSLFLRNVAKCVAYCLLCLSNRWSGQWLFLHWGIIYFRTWCACLEMLIALQKHSHSSVCMSTWRLVVEGLLDILKWNNSARRVQTCSRACVIQGRKDSWSVPHKQKC